MSTSNPGSTFSSIPTSASSSNPGNASFSWLRRPGGSSWNPTAGLGQVNPNETFLSRAMQTTYGDFLEECMEFDIGLRRGGGNNMFHDCIVVLNPNHGCVTLELCYDPETMSRIIPMCQQFQGAMSDVQWKKQVKRTFKELAEEAMDVWREMGTYNLIGSNCQDFCNYFLERMDAEQYMTTAQVAIMGSASSLATGVASGLISFFIKWRSQ